MKIQFNCHNQEIEVEKTESSKEKIVLSDKELEELTKDCDKYHEDKDNDYDLYI
jgi:hypothetical protein